MLKKQLPLSGGICYLPEFWSARCRSPFRYHIPKQRHRIQNWAANDVVLRQRVNLIVWFSDEIVERYKVESRTTPGE
jgi:hypothetical protein